MSPGDEICTIRTGQDAAMSASWDLHHEYPLPPPVGNVACPDYTVSYNNGEHFFLSDFVDWLGLCLSCHSYLFFLLLASLHYLNVFFFIRSSHHMVSYFEKWVGSLSCSCV